MLRMYINTKHHATLEISLLPVNVSVTCKTAPEALTMITPMKSVIQRNRVKLVQSLDVQDVSIWTHLISSRVISHIQVESIRAGNPANHQQVSALIDHLSRRPESDTDKFVNTLLETNRGHVACFLLDAQSSPQNETSTSGRYSPYQRTSSSSNQRSHQQNHHPQNNHHHHLQQQRRQNHINNHLHQQPPRAVNVDPEPFRELGYPRLNSLNPERRYMGLIDQTHSCRAQSVKGPVIIVREADSTTP